MRYLPLCLPLLFLGACASAYYSTMEAFGVHKRDILVNRVEDAREEQVAAQEQFQTTLEAFQELTSFDGGELEDLYERLNDEYEKADKQAGAVRERVDAIEGVSEQLFSEWETEINEMESADLRKRSEDMLDDTRDRYESLIVKMNDAASKMDPVLRSFKDHVLFLKHNLNAMAIDSLRETSLEIEGEVDDLIRDMQASIAEADEFIEAMAS